jgi:small subunit ribosomal protein S8
MTLNNSIRDNITRIKNGCRARRHSVVLTKSKLCVKLLEILRNEGYIKGFKIEKYSIVVMLKYFKDESVIKDIISYSHLSTKSTVSFEQLKQLCNNTDKRTNGLTLNILSTSLGILSDYNCLNNQIGGKLLLIIE